MLWCGCSMLPKGACAKGWVPRLVLLGGGGTLRRRGLTEGPEIVGGMPSEGHPMQPWVLARGLLEQPEFGPSFSLCILARQGSSLRIPVCHPSSVIHHPPPTIGHLPEPPSCCLDFHELSKPLCFASSRPRYFVAVMQS